MLSDGITVLAGIGLIGLGGFFIIAGISVFFRLLF